MRLQLSKPCPGLLQGTSITELTNSGVIGTFVDGEIITATSLIEMLQLIYCRFIFASTVVNDGILHSENEVVDVESIGNGFAEVVVVNEIGTGGVSGLRLMMLVH